MPEMALCVRRGLESRAVEEAAVPEAAGRYRKPAVPAVALETILGAQAENAISPWLRVAFVAELFAAGAIHLDHLVDFPLNLYRTVGCCRAACDKARQDQCNQCAYDLSFPASTRRRAGSH